MKFLIAVALFLLPLSYASPTTNHVSNRDSVIDEQVAAKAQYDSYRQTAFKNQVDVLKARKKGCTWDTVKVRKEWSTLSLKQRKSYLRAVQCLLSKPPISPASAVPGARNRFDDFLATHINQTLWIHHSSYFFPWHRYFVHAYETALCKECSYCGTQPYWDWSAHNADPSLNALFSLPTSSSPDDIYSSLGGNGASIPHNASIITFPTVPPIPVPVAPGTGGGCILTGLFTNLTTNLGPFGPPQSNTSLNYNPRCVTRDFRPDGGAAVLQYSNVTTLLSQGSLSEFALLLNGKTGVHAGGHRAVGGTQDDLYASPGDPLFYFHHAQVDHVWTIWQGQDLAGRTNLVSGTLTLMNSPPSANGTLETPMDLGFNGGTKTIGELVSTIDGPFCYIYD